MDRSPPRKVLLLCDVPGCGYLARNRFGKNAHQRVHKVAVVPQAVAVKGPLGGGAARVREEDSDEEDLDMVVNLLLQADLDGGQQEDVNKVDGLLLEGQGLDEDLQGWGGGPLVANLVGGANPGGGAVPQPGYAGRPDRAGGANWAGVGGTLGMVPLRRAGVRAEPSAARSIEEHKRSLASEQNARAYVAMRDKSIMLAHKFTDMNFSMDVAKKDIEWMEKLGHNVSEYPTVETILHYSSNAARINYGKNICTRRGANSISNPDTEPFRIVTLQCPFLPAVKTTGVVYELRLLLAQVLRSRYYAAGSLRVLTGQPSDAFLVGGKLEGVLGALLADSPLTCSVATMILDEWKANKSLRKELEDYAASIDHVLKPFPVVLQMSEDGKLVSTRVTAHPVQFRMCNLEGWVQDHPSSWIICGLLDKVKWLKFDEKKKARLTPELSLWMDESFQQLVYMSMFEQIGNFVDPLLTSSIPGTNEDAHTAPACSDTACRKEREWLWGATGDNACGYFGCSGKRVFLPVLWAVMPALSNVIGDREGRCKTGCLGKKSCFLCMCTSESLGILEQKPPESRAEHVAEVTALYSSIISELEKDAPDIAAVRKGINELKLNYGVGGAAYPGYLLPSPTYRLPFTKEGNGFHKYAYSDLMHVVKQGMYKHVVESVLLLVQARGTKHLLDDVVNAQSRPFDDGIRGIDRVSVNMSMAAQTGRVRESVARTVAVSLTPKILVDPEELRSVVSVLECIIRTHHICGHVLATEEDLRELDRIKRTLVRDLNVLRPFQKSLYAIIKLHELLHSAREMRSVGSKRNVSAESVEAHNADAVAHAGTNIGSAAHLQKRFPRNNIMHMFYRFSIDGLRDPHAPPHPSTVVPPEEVVTFAVTATRFDLSQGLGLEVKRAWGQAPSVDLLPRGAPGCAPGVAPRLEGPHAQEMEFYTTSYAGVARHKCQFKLVGGSTRKNDFIRLHDTHSALDTQIFRVEEILWVVQKKGDGEDEAVPSLKSKDPPVYFVLSEYCLAAEQSPCHKDHMVYVPKGEDVVIKVVSRVHGRVLDWLLPDGLLKGPVAPEAVLIAPSLERY